MTIITGIEAKVRAGRPGLVTLRRSDGVIVFQWAVTPQPYEDDGYRPRLPDPNDHPQKFRFDHPIVVDDRHGLEMVLTDCEATLEYATGVPNLGDGTSSPPDRA